MTLTVNAGSIRKIFRMWDLVSQNFGKCQKGSALAYLTGISLPNTLLTNMDGGMQESFSVLLEITYYCKYELEYKPYLAPKWRTSICSQEKAVTAV